jgi:hypothetical protein
MPGLSRSLFAAPVWLGLLGLAGTAPGADTSLDAAAPEPERIARWLSPLGPTLPSGDTRREPPRRLWLGVSAGVAASPGERERVFGLVELGLGLDTWLGERVGPPATPDPLELEALDSGAPATKPSGSNLPASLALGPSPGLEPRVEALGALDRTPSAALPAAHAATRCTDPRSCDPASAARLARAVVAEALRVQGSAIELSRLDGMAARSRAAASLPEVRLGAGTSQDESLRQNPTQAEPGRFTRDGGRDLWLEARLTWRLDGAIFASDEIAIMRLRAQQREDAARLSRDVLEALIDWQRARLVLASETALPEEREVGTLRQFGAVARLDVLTDGWFSRHLTPPRSSPP